MRLKFVAILVVSAVPLIGANKAPLGAGFSCVNSQGAERRINIDLRAKRYQEAGHTAEKIKEINEAAVVLKHYSTVTDGFYLVDTLDRATLVLSNTIANGDRLISTTYQCSRREPFDFASERKF